MTNIFVGNLSYDVSQDQLHNAFSAYGAVEKVNIITDRDSGQPRGFAFVEMSDAQQAADAINALNGAELNGRAMNVNEARPREERGGGNRGGGGYGNRGGGGGYGNRGGGGGGRGGNGGGRNRW